MQDKLKVALIQSNLAWEDPAQNLNRFDVHFSKIHEKVDLIVLPEMFTSGFTMNPEAVFEPLDGPSMKWLKVQSEKLDSAITGSLVIKENSQYRNRMIFMKPDGSYEFYDKRHTFTLAGEHEVYRRGEDRVNVDFRGWRINLQVCYDLRFPVWARNTDDYDVVIYVANWPKARIEAWDTLLKARAIENMAYSIGVNRVGTDGEGFEYPGHSAIYDPLGKPCISFKDDEEGIRIYELDRAGISIPREKLMFLGDRDKFNLEV